MTRRIIIITATSHNHQEIVKLAQANAWRLWDTREYHATKGNKAKIGSNRWFADQLPTYQDATFLALPNNVERHQRLIDAQDAPLLLLCANQAAVNRYTTYMQLLGCMAEQYNKRKQKQALPLFDLQVDYMPFSKEN